MIDQFPTLEIALNSWPLLVPALIVAALKVVLRSPRLKGRFGEARVNRALRRRLDPATSALLTNVTLPFGTGTTQIDHIVITPAGIFVIETKNMSGWIFGDAQSRYWTQVLHRNKRRFQNPLRQNHKHVKAVEATIGVNQASTYNLVIFAGRAEPQTPLPETVFWTPQHLTDWIFEQSAVRLSSKEITATRDRIEAARLTPGRRTDRAHVASVRKRAGIRR